MAGEADELISRAQGRLGTVLRGKYRLDRVLGVGGMAVVYSATHRTNHAEFAIKMLHPELSIRQDIATRFLREGYVGNSVKHKGAVKVLDNDVAEDGAAFLVMELLEGVGVEQLWDKHRRRLPVRVVLAIAHQLLDVLAAAHAKQIVHRDIKPANLFLTREGVVKVLDFGIARLRDATAEAATHTGMLLGTPAFMAPEQALAQSSMIDGLSDVWAAGATMFSLLTGETVHVGENAPQLMVRAATAPSRSLATVASDVSARVVAVVDRAIAFEKSRRWRSALEMRDAVRDAYLAEFSANISSGPLVALFEGAEGREDTSCADAAASTPVASEGASPTVTSAGVLQAIPRIATPAAVPIPRTMQAAGVVTAPRLALVGGTTAQPISSERSAEESVRLPRASTGRMVAGIGAVLAVLMVGGGVIALRHTGTSASSAPPDEPILSASPPAPTAPPALVATTAPPATVPDVTTAAAPATPTPGPQPARPLPAPRPGAVSSASAAKSAAPAPAPPSAAPPPAPAPAPAPTPSCHAESYLDSDGNTLYRKVCH